MLDFINIINLDFVYQEQVELYVITKIVVDSKICIRNYFFSNSYCRPREVSKTLKEGH